MWQLAAMMSHVLNIAKPSLLRFSCYHAPIHLCCRSQRLCRFATASLLSAGSSELTGATEQGEERVSMGAGKRLTLQQLQACFKFWICVASCHLHQTSPFIVFWNIGSTARPHQHSSCLTSS